MQSPEIDNLTGIFNSLYLNNHYQDYLSNNPNANLIVIDIQSFKQINDTLGHNIGDDCIKAFSHILNSNFNNSIVVRLHGDEFAILTKYTEDEIEEIFKTCNSIIISAISENKIPCSFNYNAGSVPALDDMTSAMEKADYLMYYAKRHNMNYQRFSKKLIDKKAAQEEYLLKINCLIRNNNFNYSIRQLHNREKIAQNIFQIYTKGINGNSLFSNGRYNILKHTANNLIQFDIHNIQALLEGIDFNDKKVIIPIDYKSLIGTEDLINYLYLIKEFSNYPLSNIIISINIKGIDPTQYKLIIKSIIALKNFGISIRLDKFDSYIGDNIWENTDIDYIRFANEYWQSALTNNKIRETLKAKVKVLDTCNIKSVFECIENDNQHNFLTNMTDSDILLSGNYYSQEKELKLIR